MPKKVHPADLATCEAVKRATHFTSTIRKDMRHHTFEWPTLAEAREAARLMPKVFAVNRGAIVYAITPEGWSFMVPSNMADPINHRGVTTMGLTDLAAKLGGKATSSVMQQAAETDAAKQITAAASKSEMPDIPGAFKIPDADRKAGWAGKPPIKAAKTVAKSVKAAKLPKLNWKDGEARTRHAIYRSSSLDAGRIKVVCTTASGEVVVCEKEIADMARQLAAEHESKLITGGAPAYSPPKENVMRKSAKTTGSKARGAVKAKATTAKKPASSGERHRYDWNAAEEKANKGIMPTAPDFSAPTHERFRPLLAEVKAAAAKRDVAALKAVKIAPISSSPKAVKRYRDLCVKALTSKPSAAKKSA